MSKEKPDNSYEEKDGGYHFTAWDLHVSNTQIVEEENEDGALVQVEKPRSVEEAKEFLREHMGRDVDNDTPPPKPEE